MSTPDDTADHEDVLTMTARLRELAVRLVASGPKAHAMSASECHEISEGVFELLDEVVRLRVLTVNPGATLHGSTIMEIASERDVYRAMVADLLASAHPYPTEHPTMTKQWARARELLKSGPTTRSQSHDWQPTATWFACRHCGKEAAAPHAGAADEGPCAGSNEA